MELMFLVGIAVFFSLAGSLFWFVLVGIAVKRAVDHNLAFNTAVSSAQGFVNRVGTGGQRLDPSVERQFVEAMARAQREMGYLNDIHRQKADVAMGNLMATASSAGLDWTAPY